MTPPPAPPSIRAILREAWLPGAVGYLLYFLRFGYDYAQSDQDEILPFLFSRLDVSLFTADWFVQTQASDIGVRTYFVALLEALAAGAPVWSVVLLVYLAAWALIASAVYALCRHLTGDRLAASAAVIIILALTPQWTLGGNDLVHRMLVPSMLGWGLGLWGIVLFVRRSPVGSPVLIGLATWMQALVGLQLGGLALLVLLFEGGTARLWPTRIRETARFGAIFALAALPALGPLFAQQLGPPAPVPEGSPSLFYILAAFRAPHHYLPASFSTHAVIRFAGLLALYAVGLALVRSRKDGSLAPFAVSAPLILAGVLGIAFLCTEVVPVPLVAKLQLFKFSVLLKVVFAAVACRAAALRLPDALRHRLEGLADSRRVQAGVVLAWAGVLTLLAVGNPFLQRRIPPLERRGSPLHRVENWARSQTPPDAVFAVPPSLSGFRSNARRAIVIDFKAYPFQDHNMYVWFERLTDMAPITPPERGGTAVVQALDDAYEALTPPALLALADRYDFAYLVRATPIDPPSQAFESVLSEPPWTVYRVRDPDAASE